MFIALNICRNLNESKDGIRHVPQVKNLGQVKVINLTFSFFLFHFDINKGHKGQKCVKSLNCLLNSH